MSSVFLNYSLSHLHSVYKFSPLIFVLKREEKEEDFQYLQNRISVLCMFVYKLNSKLIVNLVNKEGNHYFSSGA